ncbi:hypothetical protein ACH5RR_016654 [Cinchona calisaya]|uniref:Uncharacterized protein n=1 Tax=Cinchona calisaya TaxID=153742 RepID=A0ABD2ZWH4_9GENT
MALLLVPKDAVGNVYTVVAFCAGNKVMELYRLQVQKIIKKSFIQGIAIGYAFGFAEFLLLACNTQESVHEMSLATALKEYIVFSFATFVLVEPFGWASLYFDKEKIYYLGV